MRKLKLNKMKNRNYEVCTGDLFCPVEAATVGIIGEDILIFFDHDKKIVHAFKEWLSVKDITSS